MNRWTRNFLAAFSLEFIYAYSTASSLKFFGSSHFYTKCACVEYDVQLDIMQV